MKSVASVLHIPVLFASFSYAETLFTKLIIILLCLFLHLRSLTLSDNIIYRQYYSYTLWIVPSHSYCSVYRELSRLKTRIKNHNTINSYKKKRVTQMCWKILPLIPILVFPLLGVSEHATERGKKRIRIHYSETDKQKRINVSCGGRGNKTEKSTLNRWRRLSGRSFDGLDSSIIRWPAIHVSTFPK